MLTKPISMPFPDQCHPPTPPLKPHNKCTTFERYFYFRTTLAPTSPSIPLSYALPPSFGHLKPILPTYQPHYHHTHAPPIALTARLPVLLQACHPSILHRSIFVCLQSLLLCPMNKLKLVHKPTTKPKSMQTTKHVNI